MGDEYDFSAGNNPDEWSLPTDNNFTLDESMFDPNWTMPQFGGDALVSQEDNIQQILGNDPSLQTTLDERFNPDNLDWSLDPTSRISQSESDFYKSIGNLTPAQLRAGETPSGTSTNPLQKALDALGIKSGSNALAGALAQYLKTKYANQNIDLKNENRTYSPAYTQHLNPVQFGQGQSHLATIQAPPIKRAQGGLTGYLKGGTAGQDDKVDAELSHGEYVFDADAVSALGDGNNEAGAAKLDQMRNNIRKHKRSGALSSIPPKAKAPEQYLKGKK
jgi:hypothetical protein